MNVEKYLQGFFPGTKGPTLDTMKYFMEKLGHPEGKLKFIHIAGTNGKGSCTEMMTNIFLKSGYKVGKFISPHLIKYNERISVNNINITNKEMEKIITKLDPLVKEYNTTHERDVTLFEIETTMAIVYFESQKCDVVVMEVGMGGLYDCTNIIYPEISIINSIGYDHMNVLGNSLEEIAFQKAGIIKKNSNTIYISQSESVDKVIIDKCKKENNELYLINKKEIQNYSYNKDFQSFNYKHYKNVKIKLKGESQIYNASICIEAVDILKNRYNLPEEKVREALETVIHKGRFETLHENPTVIYDGGHNELAIKNFINSVNMYYKDTKKVFIISLLRSKDYKNIVKVNYATYDDDNIYIFTNGNSEERYWNNKVLSEEAIRLNGKNVSAINLNEAIKKSLHEYKDYTIFVVGSFYIYGDVIKYINEE